MLAGEVADQLEGFEVGWGDVVALEGEGAGFDAGEDGVRGDVG